MNLENSLGGICHVVDAIEHVDDVGTLENVIKNDIRGIIQYERLAYILADKKDFKVVKILNLNYPEFALEIIIDGENKVRKDVFHSWHSNHSLSSLYAASYGSQDTEGKYVSFFLCFDTDIKDEIESSKILELILPRLHSSFVKLYRSEIMRRANIKSLSPRETEILLWISKGKTNSEIGMILGISAYTVKNHVSNILEKLNVSNRAEALNKAMTYLM